MQLHSAISSVNRCDTSARGRVLTNASLVRIFVGQGCILSAHYECRRMQLYVGNLARLG
jgi:hypothetical protein